MTIDILDNDFLLFKSAVQKNCDISDTMGSAIFSVCGMALRLRDLNKWENNLKPWQENDPKELINWIDKKETLWEKLENTDFTTLPLLDNTYDPFDTKKINAILNKHGLFYGAGYAHALKPTFFIARIHEKTVTAGIPVIILEKEFLRDLLTLPALNQDGAVIIRRDAARLFLWDQMVFIKKSGQRFLNFALRQCGLPDTGKESRKKHFESILSIQEQIYLFHETGEIKDQIFDRRVFREMISLFPHSTVELIVRTIKDLLADTGPLGPLSRIISTRSAAGLGLMAAFQDNLFVPLFPQLRVAVEKFASSRDWGSIETARQKGFKTAAHYAENLITIYNDHKNSPDQAAEIINEKLVRPLL